MKAKIEDIVLDLDKEYELSSYFDEKMYRIMSTTGKPETFTGFELVSMIKKAQINVERSKETLNRFLKILSEVTSEEE